MIRRFRTGLVAVSALALLLASPVSPIHVGPADAAPKKEEKKDDKKSKGKDSKGKDAKAKDAKGKEAKADPKKGGAGKPSQVATFGSWGAYVAAAGKDKTCYALAQPTERKPEKLKRDPAYVFISNRPGENVRNEISIIMGFAMKDGGDGKAEIGGTTFDLVSKGSNAWVKNPAEEGQFIDAMRKGSKLSIRAPSAKGNVTTDSYPLQGFSQALDRVQKDCP